VSDPETKYKCTESSDGSWFCERLDKTIANPKRRYILAASIKDHSGKPQHPPRSSLIMLRSPSLRIAAGLDV
jgi:hypothetical protein